MFMASLLSRRFDLEIGAKFALATLRGPKLEDMNGFGQTKNKDVRIAYIVVLSTQMSNFTVRQFMKYISNAYASSFCDVFT
jgi:hypothetical protein